MDLQNKLLVKACNGLRVGDNETIKTISKCISRKVHELFTFDLSYHTSVFMSDLPPIETIRDRILCSFIHGDDASAKKNLTSALMYLETDQHKENHLKALYQILTLMKRFIPDRTKSGLTPDGTLTMSFRRLKRELVSLTRSSTKSVKTIDYEAWKSSVGVTQSQLELIFKTTAVFQLTTGCSNYCRRCNEWALPGVRKHFSFEAARVILCAFASCNNTNFILYGASDPLDWKDGHKTILDLLNEVKPSTASKQFGLLTKIPRGKEPLFIRLLESNTDIAVSVTNKNRHRIKAIESVTQTQLGRQHDHAELYIPAGLDEDFVTVKSSITDSYGTEITPDGVFMILPTFTSALAPTGQHRIPVTDATPFFLKKVTGRAALSIAYFKPLEAIDRNGNSFRLNTLLDGQIETLLLDSGSEDVAPPGMMNIKDFFSTFEAAAVLKRKSLLPTIINQTKQSLLTDRSLKKSSPSKRRAYLTQIRDYINFCNINHANRMKLFAISFFLGSAAPFLRNNPEKRLIICHLRKNDFPATADSDPLGIGNTPIDRLITHSGMDSFVVFQSLLLRLLINPDDVSIHQFIETFPSVYDPVTDRIISTTC